MIQDRNGQGAVFDPKQGFVESAGPCDPRSLVFKCERHSECNQRLVLGDQDKASYQCTVHGVTIAAAKAGLPGQRSQWPSGCYVTSSVSAVVPGRGAATRRDGCP